VNIVREAKHPGSVHIDSEIGRLRRVIVHTPGLEVESMTPRTVDEVLYNDIIPVSVVSQEHAKLKAFLSMVAATYEFTDLLAGALANEEARRELIHAVARTTMAPDRQSELRELAPETLVNALIRGLPQRRDSLTAYLSDRMYDIPPLPNLYFMRDGAAVFRDRVLFGRMAHEVRTLESLLLKTVFHYTTDLTHGGVAFDGLQEWGDDVTLEGGDVLVADANTLLVGVSERTTTSGIDRLAESLTRAFDEPLDVFAVLLPKSRATIHLDTVFTFVDRELALVHEPTILGPDHSRVLHMHLEPGRDPEIAPVGGLIHGLAKLGIDLEPVICGGTQSITQEREQWLSAANAFAFAPGKIIGYGCNTATVRNLEAAGFAVRDVDDFLSGEEHVDDYERLFVGLPGVELARGGGGPRCMTLPVEREPLASR
jgi:arginine deiminase